MVLCDDHGYKEAPLIDFGCSLMSDFDFCMRSAKRSTAYVHEAISRPFATSFKVQVKLMQRLGKEMPVINTSKVLSDTRELLLGKASMYDEDIRRRCYKILEYQLKVMKDFAYVEGLCNVRDFIADVYQRGQKTCHIEVKGNSVKFENFTDDPILCPFGVRKSATIKDVEEFLESRCFPRQRANAKQLLHSIGLDVYDPLAICRITNGFMQNSTLRIEFLD